MTHPFSTEEEMVKVFLHNSKLDIKHKYLDWNMWEAIETVYSAYLTWLSLLEK
jgi:hypothetical protein